MEPSGQEQQEVTPPAPVVPVAVIPDNLENLPKVYLTTPDGKDIVSKHTWVDLCRIKIVGDDGVSLFEDDSLQVKGRGNSTWYSFPKKPYTLKLNHQANLFGTGKSKRYVLLANWMDRTLLRNVVAFEAARRTSLEWTPDGRFVELYLNGRHLGNYWLGEKVNVEGSKFKADYLFSMDTSDWEETDFRIDYGFQPNSWQSGLPVEVKHPDRDDLEPAEFEKVLSDSRELLQRIGEALKEGSWEGMIDLDSFCDWYLVYELTGNGEPNHPKSCYYHFRDGKLVAGPVWDFDWYTFIPGEKGLMIDQSLFYGYLLHDEVFKEHLRKRWRILRPAFSSLEDYVDTQVEIIRRSEAFNHQLWPIGQWINGDENLSFQQAVDRLKQALKERTDQIELGIYAL